MVGLPLGGLLVAGEQGRGDFQSFTQRWMVDSAPVEHREEYHGPPEGVGRGRVEELVKHSAVFSHSSGV